jgi:hypothetical protein
VQEYTDYGVSEKNQRRDCIRDAMVEQKGDNGRIAYAPYEPHGE